MDGESIARQYRTAVDAFLDLVTAMPPQMRDSPEFLGDWSPRDILAHLTYWDANNVWVLESEATGHQYTLDEGDVDARNEMAVRSRRDMSWEDLLYEVKVRRDYRCMLHLRPTALDYSGAGEHWNEHREEIEQQLRKPQGPIGANSLSPGQISDLYAERSGQVVSLAEAVPPDRRTDPGVCGEWTLKDLMGHLAFWDSITIDSVTAELAGTSWSPDPRPVDEINALEALRRVDWSWDDVMDEVVRNRNRRIVLHLMPVATEISRAGEHWLEHGAQIDAWLAGHMGGE